jgi:hypothetical protein
MECYQAVQALAVGMFGIEFNGFDGCLLGFGKLLGPESRLCQG